MLTSDRIHFLVCRFVMLLCAGFAGAGFSSTLPEAGIVVMANGQVTALDADKGSRTLTRRSPVFVGDKLITQPNSQLQLRMKDGAMIAIGPDAEFIVKAYAYNASGDQKDSAVLSLVQGGLRTISGSIDKSAYRMETPSTTLGIRGTIFDVYVNSDGTTTVVLREGGVDVTGENGIIQKLDLVGLAVVAERGKPPTKPGPVPLEALNYFKRFIPGLPDNVTWQTNGDGSTSFNIGDDVINIINTPPPMTEGDGSVPGAQEQEQNSIPEPPLEEPDGCAPQDICCSMPMYCY